MLLLCALCTFGAGCGPVLYLRGMHAAEARVDQARDANAKWHAPYEYYLAEAYLKQARSEAAQASYEDAIHYARVAEEFGTRAIGNTASRRQVEQ